MAPVAAPTAPPIAAPFFAAPVQPSNASVRASSTAMDRELSQRTDRMCTSRLGIVPDAERPSPQDDAGTPFVGFGLARRNGLARGSTSFHFAVLPPNGKRVC